MNPFVSQPESPSPPLKPVVLFSVKAISIGTFLGGPLAAGVLAAVNFRRLGRKHAAWSALGVGLLASVVLFGGLLALPAEVVDRIPSALLPAFYVPLAGLWVNRAQGAQIKAILDTGAGRKASGWSTAGISLGSLVLTLGAFLPFVLAMPPFGFSGEQMSYGPGGMHKVYLASDIDRPTVDRFYAVLSESGFVSSEFETAIQLERVDAGYELTTPIARQYWTDPDLLAEFVKLRTELSATVFKAPVTIILVDEDLKGTHRKRL
jgi:hypothetical protein